MVNEVGEMDSVSPDVTIIQEYPFLKLIVQIIN